MALFGLGAALPLVASAQVRDGIPVDLSTPSSVVAELAQRAHAREISQAFIKFSLAAMGAHTPMAKRLEAKADYYEAWLSRLQDRTFPNGTIPEDLYLRAVQQRLQMPPAPTSMLGRSPQASAPVTPLGFRANATVQAVQPSWQLVGPTRTSVPYVIYYGPANSYVSGRVGGIAFDPSNVNTVYMTGSAGGVFKTTNGGTNWTNLAGITAPYVGPIAVSPTDRNLIIVGSGDFDGGAGAGNGIYRSTNGGASWTWIQPTSITNVAFSNIVFDTSTPNRILASAGRRGNSNGLWQSLDNGVSWTKVNVAGSTTRSLTTLSAGPTASNGDRPMIASSEGSAQIFASRDAGRTWTAIATYPAAGNNGYNVAVASPTDPNVAYASNSSLRTVYKGVRAANGDWSWSDITANLPSDYNWSQSFYDFHIHAAKHTVNGTVRDTVYVGLITIAAWDGSSWTDIGQTYTGSAKTHNDQHTFAVFPGDSSKMAIGNDGGIYGLTIAANGAHTINANMNGDATMAMFYSGAWHPTNSSRMFGGTQDNASPVAIGDLSNWANRTGGDGTGAAIDFRNPNRQYGAAQYLAMYGTTDAWSSQFGLNYNFPDPAGVPFVGRFSTDVSPKGYLYVGGNSWLFRYDPATQGWTPHLGNQDFAGQIRSITAAPSNPDVVYVGTTNGYIYQTRDRGTTWRTLTTNGNLGSITSISVHPTKPYDVLFSTGGGNLDTHVYRYVDASVATPAYVSASGTGSGKLPNITSSSVCRNLKGTGPDSTWYVSTDVGVFGTTTAGGNWVNMTEPFGLPPVEGATIEHTLGTGYLNLATYGRGMWRLKIDDVKTPPALSVISATIARTASNVVAVTVTIRNTGDADAVLARITGANAFFDKGATYAPFTPIPIQLGTIAAGASKTTTVTYRDSALTTGRKGVIQFKFDWRYGADTYAQGAEVPVTLP